MPTTKAHKAVFAKDCAILFYSCKPFAIDYSDRHAAARHVPRNVVRSKVPAICTSNPALPQCSGR